MKISEAFAEYRRVEIQGRGCSLKTDEDAKYTGIVAEKFFGDISVRKIQPAQVSDFYLDLVAPQLGSYRSRPVSQNTARNYVMRLRSVMRFCQQQGIKVVDPGKIVVPKREKKYANFIDIEQFDRLYEQVSQPRRGYAQINRVRNALIVKMLFYTGLRISELCALNRDTIRNRQFTVVGKSKHPRPCFITREIEQDINEYLNMRDDTNPALFIANETKERIRPGNVQRMFREHTRAIGMTRVTPHTMRHSFATRMIDDKVDIRYVADMLGHQNLNTTQQYTHVKDYKLREIYISVLDK